MIGAFFKKKRYRKLIYTIAPLSFFAIYTTSIATENKHEVVKQSESSYREVEKSEVERWLKKYEELNWFSTAIAFGDAIYETPSKMVFNKFIPSFDRVFLRLKTLDVVLSGKYEDYLDFVKEQPRESRLEWSQFQDLQAGMKILIEGNKKLSPELMREAVEFILALSEIGESETARNKAWVYEIVTSDTRGFIELAMEKHPEILPSYTQLNPEQQRVVKTILTLVRFQEIADLRAGEEAFERVRQSKILQHEPELFELALLIYVCEIAGSPGNNSFYSSPWFTKHACQNINSIRKAFHLLKERSAEDASEFYLGECSEWLGLDPGSPLNRVLARVGVMMKLYTPEEGKVLKEAFLKFQPKELSAIVTQFDVKRSKGEAEKFKGLNSLLLALRYQGDLGTAESVLITFPFIAKVLKEKGALQRNVTELNFHKIIPLVVEDPSILKAGKIRIEEGGLITLTRPTEELRNKGA